MPIEHVLVPLYELEPDGSYSIQQRLVAVVCAGVCCWGSNSLIELFRALAISDYIDFKSSRSNGPMLGVANQCGLTRPMPLILPEKLFPWMMRRGIFPNLAEGSVQQYWTHLKSIGSPLGGMSDDGCHIPLYLWGDGAQYTESGQSIMAFTCGIVIDKNRSNTWPLFLCREDPWIWLNMFYYSFLTIYTCTYYKIWIHPVLVCTSTIKEMSTGCDTIWALLEPAPPTHYVLHIYVLHAA